MISAIRLYTYLYLLSLLAGPVIVDDGPCWYTWRGIMTRTKVEWRRG